MTPSLRTKVIRFLMAMVVFTIPGCISDDEPKGKLLQVGDSLPEFSVNLNNGQEISSVSLKGHVAVIVFFNTNCKDCQKELPEVQKLWEEYQNVSEVKIVLIAREESLSEIEEYWEAQGFTMPFSPQENREIYSLFAPSVIPRIFIANPQGVVSASFDDSDMPSLQRLQQEINLILTSNS